MRLYCSWDSFVSFWDIFACWYFSASLGAIVVHMAAVSPGRYWNPRLTRGYQKAALTPVWNTYTFTFTPNACQPRSAVLRGIPDQPLENRLKASDFQAIAAPVQHSRLPPLPCYVNNPARKRKRDTCATKKTDLPDGSFYRSRKIRLWPTHAQRLVLWRWLAAKRAFYNKGVEIIREYMRSGSRVPSKLTFRNIVRERVFAENPWISASIDARELPLQICANGAFAAHAAYSSNMAKKEKNTNHRFRLDFQNLARIDLTPTEVLQFDPSTEKNQGTVHEFVEVPSRRRSETSKRADIGVKFGAKLGIVRATDSIAVVQELLQERRPKFAPAVQWDKRMRAFYIILKRVAQRPPDTNSPANRDVLAFDPGSRTFNAFYRPDGLYGELLHDAEPHIRRLCLYSDRLRSARDTSETDHQKKVLSARMLRVNARLSNFIRNAHYESIKACFSMADFMILPIFNTDRMVRRAERVFSSETARSLYTWSHYRFAQRMWHKVETTAHKQMAFTSEPGTTKTCDACGHVNPSVGGSRFFQCPLCNYATGRDFHGARGNLLAAYGFAQS